MQGTGSHLAVRKDRKRAEPEISIKTVKKFTK